MRLIAIKIAGFKSFVDPVRIPVAGQMVGIVGPNGCGKSNVIDAVRWVMGESQARQLRGASMADVIFNGSADRKPISRASVELLFDNSDGRAAGAWSQYAELSVKRVLTRNGESAYYINQMQVRRRDLLDVFLGTGLSARTSYAIIEQGMISRIIEARPDELRGFLEEAAGISRYKERRRETEARLAQVRDNLTRLDDVRRTLAEQMVRLTEQAETARQWQDLQHQLLHHQQLLWLFRWREASDKILLLDGEIEQIEHALQAQQDALTTADTDAIMLREQQAQVNTALNEAQGQFYAAASETTRLEQAVQHVAQTRRQREEQQSRLLQQMAALEHEIGTSQHQQQTAQLALQAAQQNCAIHDAGLQAVLADVPTLEQRERDSRQAVGQLQRELAQVEQAVQVTQTHLQHLRHQAEATEQRYQRVLREQQSLPKTDSAGLAAAEHALEQVLAQQAIAKDQLALLRSRQQQHEQALQQAQSQLQIAERAQHLAEGELAGLRAAQQQETSDQSLDTVLRNRGLADMPRLWQVLEVPEPWVPATEQVLGERLQAVVVDDAAWQALLADLPVGLCVLRNDATSVVEQTSSAQGLLEHVGLREGQSAALQDWLGHLLPVDDMHQAGQKLKTLLPGTALITPEGHVLGKNSVVAAGRSDRTAGVLTRRAVIEQLDIQLCAMIEQTASLRNRHADCQVGLAQVKREVEKAQRQEAALQQDVHRLQMDCMNRRQRETQHQQREQRLQADLGELESALQRDRQALTEHEAAHGQHTAAASTMREHVQKARQQRQEAEIALTSVRTRQHQLENQRQEARYQIRLEENRLADLKKSADAAQQRREALQQDLNTVQTDLLSLDDKSPAIALASALETRQSAEQVLTRARMAVDAAQHALRTAEEQRMRLQQSLDPLRQRLEAARLKRGEAGVAAENAQEQLQRLDANAVALAVHLPGVKPGALNQRIVQIEKDMQALGAVNLLALQELEQIGERADFLAAQHADLEAAIQTLLAAMQAMDQETRSLFRSTFETVNASMGELFASLFGGGKAELALTEGEWLDAGVQVMAQPPGKKNSSIHLLSGGEKALTALALVFSLFRLNPAPFCLLDEVDAPLDDTNTERYARLVTQMSDAVQFLFITHNRITMEAAGQLIGVTMQEPGVSRIVSVDLEQATRLAAQ